MRCRRFTARWGFGVFYMARLFALCTKKPSIMMADAVPIGEHNNRHLLQDNLLPMREVSIEVDWTRMQRQRAAVLKHTEVPPYLILPEVQQLLNHCYDDTTYQLINILWHTGTRISECLTLTPRHFVLDADEPYLSVNTLKQKQPRQGRAKPRYIPISDDEFIASLKRFIRARNIKHNEPLFAFAYSAAIKRIKRFVAALDADLQPLISVTPHTFRHSFAINAVIQGIPSIQVLQGWLGHKTITSTLIYTQILALETHHFMQKIQFRI